MNQLFNQPCWCLDFAVSWDFFRAHCWEVHGYDPGSPETPLEPQLEASMAEREVIHRQSSMSQQEHDILDQLAKRVDWLQKKLLEKEKKAQEKDSKYY